MTRSVWMLVESDVFRLYIYKGNALRYIPKGIGEFSINFVK